MLLSPSVSGLQQMLHTCVTFSYYPRVMFNAKKSIHVRVAVGKTKKKVRCVFLGRWIN